MIAFADIARAALPHAEAIVRDLAPGCSRQGGELFMENPRRADHSLGSFSVNLRTGCWHERATGEGGGDLISLWAYLAGLNQREAACELAAFLGLPVSAGPRRRDGVRPLPRPPLPPAKDDIAASRAAVARIWGQSGEAVFSGTKTYIKVERRLSFPTRFAGAPSAIIRAYGSPSGAPTSPAWSSATGPSSAMIRRIPEPVAIQRWYFGPDGKALRGPDGRRVKKMLGPVKDAAIKLTDDADVIYGLVVAEGFETALATYLAGWRPTWALGSACALASFPILAGIALTIFADHDDAGLEAARVCRDRWRAAGCEAVIRRPPTPGADAADLASDGAA